MATAGAGDGRDRGDGVPPRPVAGRTTPRRGRPGRRVTRGLLVVLIVGPIIAGLAWQAFAGRTLAAESQRRSYERQAVSDARYFDEVLTMSATMAALTGDPSWVRRYRQAEEGLAASLDSAATGAGSQQVTQLLATNAANDALLALEHQALDAIAAGDLAQAQQILASPEYARWKAAYGESVAAAAAMSEQSEQGDLTTWAWLLAGQSLLLLGGVLVTGLLAWWLLRGTRRWAAGEITRRDEGLRAALDAIRDPLVVLTAVRDAQGRIEDFEFADANEAGCGFHRLPYEQLIGSRLLARQPRAAESGLLDRLAALVATGEPLVLDDWEYAPDPSAGPGRHYDIRAVRVGVGDTVCQTFRDVTERATSAAALRESERRFRALAENAADLVYETDAKGRIVWVAPEVAPSLGWTPAELLGRRGLDLLHPDDDFRRLPPKRGGGSDMPAPSASTTRMVRLRSASGDYRWMSAHVTEVIDGTGAFCGAVVGMEDVDDLVQARHAADAARLEERRARLSMDIAAIGMAMVSPSGRFIDVNRSLCLLLMYTRAEMVALGLPDIVYPDEAPDPVAQVIGPGPLAGSVITQRRRFRTRSGDAVWADLSVVPIRDDDGDIAQLVAQFVDVTLEVVSVEALERSMQQYRMLAENATDVVYRASPDGIIEWISGGVDVVLGRRPEDLIGRPLDQLIHPEDRALAAEALAAIRGGGRVSVRFRVLLRDAQPRWVEATGHRVTGESGATIAMVGGWRDVDAEVRALAELDHRARTDPLTGLLNRTELLERLRPMLQRPRRGQSLAIAFLDLDQFKAINDTRGHAAGDAVLTTVAARLRAWVRAGDLVARMGGDELLVVLENVSNLDVAVTVLTKLAGLVARPVSWEDDRVLRTSASIGVTLAVGVADLDQVIARADEAMYQAKKSGGNRVVALPL